MVRSHVEERTHAHAPKKEADRVLVRTAESWEGAPVEAQVETLQGALDGCSVRGWRTSSAPPSSDRAAHSLAAGRVVNPANLTPRELEVLACSGTG